MRTTWAVATPPQRRRYATWLLLRSLLWAPKQLARRLAANEILFRPDARMPQRLRAYAALAEERYGLPVCPVVVNLLPPRPAEQVRATPSAHMPELLDTALEAGSLDQVKAALDGILAGGSNGRAA